jgi:hypothetical protein
VQTQTDCEIQACNKDDESLEAGATFNKTTNMERDNIAVASSLKHRNNTDLGKDLKGVPDIGKVSPGLPHDEVQVRVMIGARCAIFSFESCTGAKILRRQVR